MAKIIPLDPDIAVDALAARNWVKELASEAQRIKLLQERADNNLESIITKAAVKNSVSTESNEIELSDCGRYLIVIT